MAMGCFYNQFILNLLAGYEWKISDRFTIEFSGKLTIAGGAPYTAVDTLTSSIRNTTVYLHADDFSLRYPDYSRFDIKIDFRHNMNFVSIIGFISAENLFNRKNVSQYYYDLKDRKVKPVYQYGLFPIGEVKVEF